jgi:hypothetical protein
MRRLACVIVCLAGCDPDPEDLDLAGRVLSSEACASCAGDCRDETLEVSDGLHVSETLDYPDPPPTGGPHHPCWADWGVHASEVADERWVHNLEHGGVVIVHGAGADGSSASSWVSSKGSRALSSPYAALPVQWAAVAWQRRLLLGCWDEAAVESFYAANVAHAPEDLTAGPPGGCD